MTPVKAFLNKHLVMSYFVLAFAISWGAVIIVAGKVPIPVEHITIVGLAMLLGPSLAGILLTGLASGKEGLRELFSRLRRWRVGVHWYTVAILTIVFLSAVILLALSCLSPDFLPPVFTSADKAAQLLTAIMVGLVVGFFEELGWTGFAIPRLRQRYGFLATGLIVGLLWGAWHFIVFWESDSFSGIFPLVLLLARLFANLPAYRILMVWVYDHTKSLFIAILMHATLTGLVFIEPPLTGGNLLIYMLVRGAALWILIAVVFLVKRRAPRRNRSITDKEI